MAHEYKKTVPNMVGMRADAKEALIMKDMGNGHTRPFMWGSEVTMSGSAEKEIARGTMGGVFVDDCIYLITPTVEDAATKFYVDKDAATHTVKIKRTGNTGGDAAFDVLMFMSTATTVTVSDYAGKRGYQTGNY